MLLKPGKNSVVTLKNTVTFRKQLKELGFSFDWSRETKHNGPEIL